MEKFLESNFWTELLKSTQDWLIHELPGILILVVLFIISIKFLSIFTKRLEKSFLKRSTQGSISENKESVKRVETLSSIIHGLVKIILWVVFIMILLQKFGINIAPIIAGAGILGLAVGFGSQMLVRDYISGFFIILEDQLRNGDVAIINGKAGLVEKIEFRTTTLRDFSGVVHVIRNGEITLISNMTKDWSAMVFDIGVAYKEDPQQVMDIMKKVGDDLYHDPEFSEHILEPIEIFGLDEFADSALIIKARLKTVPIQQWMVGREFRKRLKKSFDQNDIEIPFPHTTVYWGDKINPLKLDVSDQIINTIETSK
ncbi:MAG: mechanosensitive ion channel family protein [Bacteroidales bacterium]|nr:mechanosensitive ion channel family protein [Bacteroidales bacterium]